MKLSVFWFRRDLRLEDNTALSQALNSGMPVLPVFIFDENILNKLSVDDARVTFIYENLAAIQHQLQASGSSLKVFMGNPETVWIKIFKEFKVGRVFLNMDYEPYARKRDGKIQELALQNGAQFHIYKDQVIFDRHEVLKGDGQPYTVFTPYKRKWLDQYNPSLAAVTGPLNFKNFNQKKFSFPSLKEVGFKKSSIKIRKYDLSVLAEYPVNRDIPYEDATSYLSPHLRFGTVSIRQVIQQLKPQNDVFLSELIWREFFMQILYHYPQVVTENFKRKYDNIRWRNVQAEFDTWCRGQTGFPMVDAGMRQLNETGYMHNRVRMITAGFLCKHLLTDWRLGEAYFAQKLLDYELSSNNGNWQWAAGTGCDAAPYFRVFNPTTQLQKFDTNLIYIKKWLPEYGTDDYPAPMVEHAMARQRAIAVYKEGFNFIR